MNDHTTTSGWARFWNKGGWWRAVLAVVAYLVVFLAIGTLIATVAKNLIDTKNLIGDPASIFFGIALPDLLGSLVALAFVISVGWRKQIFGRQPIAGRPWMWVVLPLVLIPIVLRLVATDWASHTVAVVFALLFAGLFVGFSEELVTRGIAVTLLRKAGHSERVVMVISSALFGLMHSTNVLNGTAPLTVLVTVVYAFGFGTMMYLAMRVTGSIIVPMLLHAATDPTTFLATGAVDATGAASGNAGLIGIAGIFNIAYFVLAILAIFLVKGRVEKKAAEASALA